MLARSSKSTNMSINRNIVECKYKKTEDYTSVLIVLIETLWNVNMKTWWTFVKEGLVLIETLWNVNLSDRYKKVLPEVVLIETLWNVNSLTVFVSVIAFIGY